MELKQEYPEIWECIKRDFTSMKLNDDKEIVISIPAEIINRYGKDNVQNLIQKLIESHMNEARKKALEKISQKISEIIVHGDNSRSIKLYKERPESLYDMILKRMEEQEKKLVFPKNDFIFNETEERLPSFIKEVILK